MGQNRALTASEHRGKQTALPDDCAMTDREGAAEERLQKTRRCAIGYFVIAESERTQLISRDNTMLPSGQRRNGLVGASGAPFTVHGHIRRTGTGFVPRVP